MVLLHEECITAVRPGAVVEDEVKIAARMIPGSGLLRITEEEHDAGGDVKKHICTDGNHSQK